MILEYCHDELFRFGVQRLFFWELGASLWRMALILDFITYYDGKMGKRAHGEDTTHEIAPGIWWETNW